MNTFPLYINVVFVCAILLLLVAVYYAVRRSKAVMLFILAWILLQGIVGYSGFYTDLSVRPPRIFLTLVPPTLLIIALFFTAKGRAFMDRLDIRILTLIHMVRVPIEMVLYWLMLNKALPLVMTFEGRNFDILSGITAPLVWYFGFVRKKMGRGLLLAWNVICLLLLINIVTHAILSAPFPFQQFGFEQPNRALVYFPFNLLPAFVVPVVLLSQVAAIRQLLSGQKAAYTTTG
jgi:hypothetical protein